jgi:iron complex transport system substrate-binding protein
MRQDVPMRRLALWPLLFAMTAAAQAEPQRIVSFNICADQLVLALADPAQIAGLSPYAADPGLSVMAERAKAHPRLEWQAEATIPLDPDLVLVGAWDRPATRRLLVAFGFRVVDVAQVETIAAARDQITAVAALVGHPERGERLIASLDAAREKLRVTARTRVATALVIERGGFTAGADTLVAAMLVEAGLKPPAGAPGGFGGFVPLERLIALHPDFVVLKDPPEDARDQGALYLTHPGLRALYPPARRIALPTRYALCGGPALIAALDYLSAQIARLPAE